MSPHARPALHLSVLLLATTLAGCASWRLPALSAEEAPGAALNTPEQVWALTDGEHLVHFAAATPQRLDRQCTLSGLRAGDQLLGIDYRVAHGQLYGLGRLGQLYRLDTTQCQASPVGDGIGWPLLGARVGIDFNPTVDRLRVVTEAGQNLRVHPETGAVVDSDPQAPGVQTDGLLGYVDGDAQAGRAPRVVAAGYTYNARNSKITTNYAIDLAAGQLVMQGSHEDATPPVSPNTGRLRSVGPLGVPGVTEADLDISDERNTALAVLRTDRSRLYRIDLATGAARLIGLVGDGAPVRSIAIEP